MFRYRLSYGLLLLAAFVFCIFFKEYLSFFTFLFLLLLPLFPLLFLLSSVRKTNVSLETDCAAANKRRDFCAYIVLKNTSLLPLAGVKIQISFENTLSGDKKEEILFLPVNSKAEQRVEYRMCSQYCGRIRLQVTKITYYDFLGIFSVHKAPAAQAEVFVTPGIYPIDLKIDRTAATQAESSVYSKIKPGDAPSEIFDIRPYRSGDRLRSIHWKLSSKLDELMVKEFSLPTDSAVLLLVELLAPDMERADALIETFASLSHFLTENGIQHRIEWYDARNSRMENAAIENEEDLAVLLNAVLSSSYYRDVPYALKSRESMDSMRCAHVIYITGGLTDALPLFFGRMEGIKATVLYTGNLENDQDAEFTENLKAMHISVVEILPNTIQDSLSGITI
ncbi:MAG: DUF58 domain-containing protein [Clostridiales bacterium]|nr:DUF58 domain-containing protein [Clostridiales bacterium]